MKDSSWPAILREARWLAGLSVKRAYVGSQFQGNFLRLGNLKPSEENSEEMTFLRKF